MALEDWPFADTWSLHGNREIVSRYEILERIGEGTFGEVYRARRREDDLIVALKEIHNCESSCREVEALLLLDHPNVVKVHEYFTQGNSVVLVLEYLPHNLYELIRATKGNITEGEVKGWSIQLLRGLAACQAASILHRDLKPSNLLIAGDGTLKIADFGQARVISKEICGKAIDDSENTENCVAESEELAVTGTPITGGYGNLEQQAEIDGGEDVSTGPVEPQLETQSPEVSNAERCESGEDGSASKSKPQQSPQQGTGLVPPEPTLGIPEKREMNDRNLVPGPLIDFSPTVAVNGSRNYFTVEEMARSGASMSGPQISGLQVHDPGCCGWFALENSENRPGMNGLKRLTPGIETESEEGTFHIDGGYFAEREEDLSSDDSDVDWRGKYGIRKEDLIEVVEQTAENRKTGLFSGSGKGEGDFLQKLGRFIRKRTRRLTTEEKVATKNESLARGVGKIGDEVQRDGIILHMQPVRVSETKDSTNIRNELLVKVESAPGADENISRSNGEHSCLQARGTPIKSLVNHTHEYESQSIKVGSTNGRSQGPFVAERDPFKNSKGLSDVVGLTNDNSGNETVMTVCVRQTSGGKSNTEKFQEHQAMRSEVESDIRDEGMTKLSNSVPSKVDGKISSRFISNGPLREMAYASAHEVCDVTMCKSNPGFKSDHVDKREFSQVDTYNTGCTRSINVGKSQYYLDGKQGKCDDMVWCDVEGAELNGTADSGAVGVNKGPPLNSCDWKDASTTDGMEREKCERNSTEVVPGKDFTKSWEQMEGQSSALSDAEGTRWYGAPEFQYSYMEPKNEVNALGKVTVENCGVTTGSEEEWEDGLEGGIYHRRGTYAPESSGRSDRASEDGSDFTTMVGTRWYKPPELLYGARTYGMDVDIWAVGCIFGELLLGKPLFPGINDIDQLSRLVKVLGAPSEKNWAGVSLLPDFDKICFEDVEPPLTLRKFLPHVSEDALQFLERLLTYNPAWRPTAAEALADSFFFKSPLPCPCDQLNLPTMDKSEASDEEWGDWKDPGSPFSDFEILG